MVDSNLSSKLSEMIAQRDFTTLHETLCSLPPADIAEILHELPSSEGAVLLRLLPRPLAADVFENLSFNYQEEILHALGSKDVAQILNDIDPDDRTALLEELPSAVTQKLIDLLNPEERRIAVDLLGYPKDSVGRLMKPEYVAIQEHWTVAQVFSHLRAQHHKRESMNQLYVVDEQGRLMDYVRLRNLVVADPDSPIKDLFEHRNFSLCVTDDEKQAVAVLKKYDVTMLPVVDSNQVLLGVVTVDDVFDVAETETTEDIQRLGGVEALTGPYFKIGIFDMLKKRAPWLSILFIGEMFTSTAMGYFESEIERAAVLAIFLPLILSSGGNSGSQATTIIIRAMALGDVHLRDWWRVFYREIITGFLLGTTLATLGVLRILSWQFLGIKDYGLTHMHLALTVGGSLVGIVLWGSLMGAMLPILLRRLKLDPATCSAPFVATFVDVTGIIIYFSIAYALLLPHLPG